MFTAPILSAHSLWCMTPALITPRFDERKPTKRVVHTVCAGAACVQATPASTWLSVLSEREEHASGGAEAAAGATARSRDEVARLVKLLRWAASTISAILEPSESGDGARGRASLRADFERFDADVAKMSGGARPRVPSSRPPARSVATGALP